MGNNSRKKHSPEFKAKVALEALKEQMTLSELEKEFWVSQCMISRWKGELMRNASQSFGARFTLLVHSSKDCGASNPTILYPQRRFMLALPAYPLT